MTINVKVSKTYNLLDKTIAINIVDNNGGLESITQTIVVPKDELTSPELCIFNGRKLEIFELDG